MYIINLLVTDIVGGTVFDWEIIPDRFDTQEEALAFGLAKASEKHVGVEVFNTRTFETVASVSV